MDIPKILIVERAESAQKYYSYVLHEYGEILRANSIEQTLEHLFLHPDIAVVLMTSRLISRDEPDTLGLIVSLRKSHYRGPIIAISTDPGYRRKMRAAGCTHEYDKDGLKIVRIVTDILAERTAAAKSGVQPPIEALEKAQ